MSRGIRRFKELFDLYKVSFIKNSFFYRMSLDRRWNVFDSSKFITDPWAGDSDIGRRILDCSFIPDDGGDVSINIMEIFSKRRWNDSSYASSFVWMRDLQSLGGNNSRKYARNLISTFIAGYRKTRKFWHNEDSWGYGIVGERIINWIFSYSFFASGSSDKFQREVLSSINEQFSHLLKCYKAELNPYSRLMALKAILFCFCVMRTHQRKQIKRKISEICEVVQDCVRDGMFESRSPLDNFHIFRSLLEIRFIAKVNAIDLPIDVFGNVLSKMAANVRFLRLGDGRISSHSGNSRFSKSTFTPSRHMIDTALSVVEIKDKVENSIGFERLATKKSTVIVNNVPCDVKSKFNDSYEPGINIFDFEASFGIDRLINRSDVSVVFDGLRVKLGKSSDNFSNKIIKDNMLFFEGETQFSNRFFKFAMKRELEVLSNKSQLNGTDFVFLSKSFDTFFRFVFNKKVELKQINPKNILISLFKSEYIFNIITSEALKINILQGDDLNYPSIEILSSSDGSKEVRFSWSIECVK